MFDTFNGCKYNINVVTAMTYSFTECKSLSSLPDISECNTNNAKDMSWMFFECKSLSSLLNISKWKKILLIRVSCLMDVNHYHLYLIFKNVI